MSSLFQSVPPSLARIRITAPTTSLTSITKLGLTADDLKPIDWRQKAPLQAPKNQKKCGNCWAMSSTAVLTDKFRLPPPLGKGLADLNLDPMILTQCTQNEVNNGCCGNDPNIAALFLEKVGLPRVSSVFKDVTDFDGSCNEKDPKNPITENMASCQELTSQMSGVKTFKALPDTTISAVVQDTSGNVKGEETIVNMKNALNKGPFVSCFNVTFDFEAATSFYTPGNFWPGTNGIFVSGSYTEDIENFIKKSGNTPDQVKKNNNLSSWTDIMGQHAVETVGWGVDDKTGLEYWIVKNSWGTEWCDGGYFKIAMNSQKNKFANSALGFDVPVVMKDKSLFGGATFFDADLNSGDDVGDGPSPNPRPSPSPQNQPEGKKPFNYFLWVGLPIIILALLMLGYVLYTRRGSMPEVQELSSASF